MKKIYLLTLIVLLVVIGIGVTYLIFNIDTSLQNELINKNTSEKNNITSLNNTNVSIDTKSNESNVENDKIIKNTNYVNTNYEKEDNTKNAKMSEKQVIKASNHYLSDLNPDYEAKHIKKYDSNAKIWYVAYGKHNGKKYLGYILIDDQTGRPAVV